MNSTAGTSNNCIEAIQRVVGDAHVRPATAEDALDAICPSYIVEPASGAELAQALRLANAANLRVVARGGGSKIDWGNPPKAVDIVLSAKRLDRILEHAAGDMTATVQAGCTVAAFGDALGRRGQRLALDPLWPERATIGGILATDDNGALRAAYGTLRDHLIGITVALADGTVAKSGGKVVKNVAGYDLPKLFTGSFGTLGVIIEATFRLYPLAHAAQTLRFAAPAATVLARILSALAGCALVTSAIQIEAADDGLFRLLILVEGLAEAIEGKVQRVRRAVLDGGGDQIEVGADAWTAREQLFVDARACVCKVSILPTHLPQFVERLRQVVTGNCARWRMLAQAVGVGLVSLHAESTHLPDTLASLRAEVAKVAGSLVVLRCPLDLKRQIDVWPDAGNALPLMRRIKDQFDPKGTLSPGRFIGGI